MIQSMTGLEGNYIRIGCRGQQSAISIQPTSNSQLAASNWQLALNRLRKNWSATCFSFCFSSLTRSNGRFSVVLWAAAS